MSARRALAEVTNVPLGASPATKAALGSPLPAWSSENVADATPAGTPSSPIASADDALDAAWAEARVCGDLCLSGMGLQALDDRTGQLIMVVRLQLDGNRFDAVPESVRHLSLLQSFSMRDNRLTQLDGSQLPSLHLTRLDVAWNRITSLTASVRSLRRLTSLNLSHNRLTSVPHEVTLLPALTELVLQENALTSLPHDMTSLHRLRTLCVSDNALTSLPARLPPSLTDVDASRNCITRLRPADEPYTLASLPALRCLRVGNNRLARLPLLASTQLRELELPHNNVQHLALPQSPHLRLLNVASNALACVPACVGTMHALEELYAAHNAIAHVSPAIGACASLRVLELSHNRLRMLPAELSHCSSLNKLKLRHNDLAFVSPALADLPQLFDLDLHDNPRLLAGGSAPPNPPDDGLQHTLFAADSGAVDAPGPSRCDPQPCSCCVTESAHDGRGHNSPHGHQACVQSTPPWDPFSGTDTPPVSPFSGGEGTSTSWANGLPGEGSVPASPVVLGAQGAQGFASPYSPYAAQPLVVTLTPIRGSTTSFGVAVVNPSAPACPLSGPGTRTTPRRDGPESREGCPTCGSASAHGGPGAAETGAAGAVPFSQVLGYTAVAVLSAALGHALPQWWRNNIARPRRRRRR